MVQIEPTLRVVRWLQWKDTISSSTVNAAHKQIDESIKSAPWHTQWQYQCLIGFIVAAAHAHCPIWIQSGFSMLGEINVAAGVSSHFGNAMISIFGAICAPHGSCASQPICVFVCSLWHIFVIFFGQRSFHIRTIFLDHINKYEYWKVIGLFDR